MFAVHRAIRVAPRQAPRLTYAARPFAPRFYASESTSQPATPSEQDTQPAAEPSNTETQVAQSNGNGSSGDKDAKVSVQYAKSRQQRKTPASRQSTSPVKQLRKDLRSDAAQEDQNGGDLPVPAQFQQKTIAYSNPNQHATKDDTDINWEASFHGIATRPATKEQFDVLMRPLELGDVEVKPDGIIYLPEIKYRRRLNEAFGPMGWGLIPKGDTVVGDSIVTREYALIVDGRFVSQAQGENSYFSPEQLPSAVEGCKSNALMRCCKDLGIGSELWDPTFIRYFKKTQMQEVWVEHMSTKKKRTLWFKSGAVEVSYPWKRV